MKLPVIAVLAIVFSGPLALPALAQASPSTASSSSDGSERGGIVGYFDRWVGMVEETQSEQPHWMAPIATTTPRLEQEFRFDVDWAETKPGVTTDTIDGGNGLEIIPEKNIEVIFNLPPYLEHHSTTIRDGYGDVSFLVKYRLFAANAEHGNYILTAFLGWSIPTGSYNNGARNAILTPTIAYGKGYGNFDLQGTFGVTLPTGNEAIIGRTLLWNDTFQYHIFHNFWPEVEMNYSHFQDGDHDGMTQVFVTPGLMVGRLHVWKSVSFAIGGGYQIATTHFHTSNHNGIFSVRFLF